MDQDATWYGGIGLDPGHIVLDGLMESQLGPQRKHSSPLIFRRMPIVAKQSPISEIAELLLFVRLHLPTSFAAESHAMSSAHRYMSTTWLHSEP